QHFILERRQPHLQSPSRQNRPPTTSILQNQRCEHGTVRENPDHRRRLRRRAVHRRLYSSCLFHRLPPFSSGRDNREEGSPGSLYNPPELVVCCLQPRHEEGLRLRGRQRRMDRRERLQQTYDEVYYRISRLTKSESR